MLIRKNLEFRPRPFVCPSLCLSAERFLGLPSLIFSETLQLVRACKGGKKAPSAFLKKSLLAHIGQKLSKIGQVFRIFLGIPALLFSKLCN